MELINKWIGAPEFSCSLHIRMQDNTCKILQPHIVRKSCKPYITEALKGKMRLVSFHFSTLQRVAD
ncbi:hypothetical protein D3C78_862100 [compost metagenome]